jgi:REP element-mobilizing transposase RayT
LPAHKKDAADSRISQFAFDRALDARQRKDAADSRISGARFVAFDRVLDARATGPDWLLRPDVAEAVVRAIFTGRDKGFYELGSWVVMPNHVHVLLRPLVELSRVVSGIKVSSARDANRLLDRTGAFWSRDYFERWIRDSGGEQRVVRYIENNPVKAGLCREAAGWRFSSAGG